MKKNKCSGQGRNRPRGPESGTPGGQSKSVGDSKQTKVKKNGYK